MLRISKLSDHATLVMHHMATYPGELLSAAQIASAVERSLPTVVKLLKMLQEAGLVGSERGAAGGYRLVKAPDQISLAEIITAIEGQPAMTTCCSTKQCDQNPDCVLMDNWMVINRAIMGILESVSLQAMTSSLMDIPCLMRSAKRCQCRKVDDQVMVSE